MNCWDLSMDNNKLYQPIEFWGDKIKLLDNRAREIANTFGFGKIGLELIIKHGKIIDVVFTEKITVRQIKKNEKTQKDASK